MLKWFTTFQKRRNLHRKMYPEKNLLHQTIRRENSGRVQSVNLGRILLLWPDRTEMVINYKKSATVKNWKSKIRQFTPYLKIGCLRIFFENEMKLIMTDLTILRTFSMILFIIAKGFRQKLEIGLPVDIFGWKLLYLDNFICWKR